MKRFKRTDFWINIVLITGFCITSIIRQDETFIIGYFVVGGWQCISMAVHAYNHWFTQKGSVRYVYHWITFISVITMPVGSFFILLFTAPVMALYYTIICHEEVYIKMKRPIAALK